MIAADNANPRTTALHIAVRMGHDKRVRWPLSFGADKTVQMKEPFDGLTSRGTKPMGCSDDFATSEGDPGSVNIAWSRHKN
jgi:hypothetical protein